MLKKRGLPQSKVSSVTLSMENLHHYHIGIPGDHGFLPREGTVIAWWHGSDTSTEAPGAPRGFSESVQGWSFIVPILVVYNQP